MRPLSSDNTLNPASANSFEHDLIHDQISRVLPDAHAGRSPIGRTAQCVTDRIAEPFKQLERFMRHDPQGSLSAVVCARATTGERLALAVIDVAGFIAEVKGHAIDHGFHVHDERHFVETYSLRQLWEVDLHPEEACSGPIDLHLSLEVDPRALLGFEDEVVKMDDPDDTPPSGYAFPLLFTWTLPPLPHPPDLLILATELAGVGGLDLPVEVSAIDSFASVTDAPERSLSIVARLSVDLADVYSNGDEPLCTTLDRCKDVSLFLLDRAPVWLDES